MLKPEILLYIGKPCESMGRKAMGLRPKGQDCQVAVVILSNRACSFGDRFFGLWSVMCACRVMSRWQPVCPWSLTPVLANFYF